MKVKDFIEFIRPITAINPECELFIVDNDEELDLSSWLFETTHVDIHLTHRKES